MSLLLSWLRLQPARARRPAGRREPGNTHVYRCRINILSAHCPDLVGVVHRPTPQPGRIQRSPYDALEGERSLHRVSGTIVDAAEDPKYSSVKAEIDVTTLITCLIRSATTPAIGGDFFDVANHPTMTFESRRARARASTSKLLVISPSAVRL